MSACPGISRVKENFIVKGNLLEFISWEQKTGIIKTCSDEGCYQDKIRTQSFRGHTLKGFSVYFFFQALWALGKFVWNCSQVMGRCMWEGLSSVQAIQPASLTSGQGRGHLQGWLVTPSQGRIPWPHFCDTCFVLVICRTSWLFDFFSISSWCLFLKTCGEFMRLP